MRSSEIIQNRHVLLRFVPRCAYLRRYERGH
jgi:hypothetical protein